jgi:CDP-diacylglycerol--serine O-phosphatidyltransferase
MLDGRVARLAGMTSRFGAELDSLADVISFGVAPALLARSLMDAVRWPPSAVDRLAWVPLGLYVAGAAVRLARYNVEAVSPSNGRVGEKGKSYFVGLPSPAAAGMAVSPVLLYHWLVGREATAGLEVNPERAKWVVMAMPFLMLGLAWLMVSRVRYMHVGNRLFTGRQRLWPVLGVLALAVFTVRFWEVAGTLLFGGYVIAFLVWDLARTARSARQRRRQELADRRGSTGCAP